VGALTAVHRRQWGPWWLWTIVVILAAGTAYAGLWVRSAMHELAQAENARAILAANRENIQADRLKLKQQLDEAREAESTLRADLDRSRAEGDAVAALVGKLEKRATGLEAELAAARTDAAESKKAVAAEAAGAKTAFAQVANLQERLAALKSELDAARAETARAAQEKAALERELAELKDEIEKLRAAAPAVTGTTQTSP
jgi:chromosome segregation ATPase